MAEIYFIGIPITELKPLITLAFQDDALLLSKYSLLDNPTLEESVDKNYQTIVEAYNKEEMVQCIEVGLDDGETRVPIGFTVLINREFAPQELFSFGINIAFRNRKNSVKWLNKVKEVLGKFIYTGLHPNNTRAIDFFVKNGFTKEEIVPGVVTLTSNFKELIKIKEKEVAYGS